MFHFASGGGVLSFVSCRINFFFIERKFNVLEMCECIDQITHKGRFVPALRRWRQCFVFRERSGRVVSLIQGVRHDFRGILGCRLLFCSELRYFFNYIGGGVIIFEVSKNKTYMVNHGRYELRRAQKNTTVVRLILFLSL